MDGSTIPYIFYLNKISRIISSTEKLTQRNELLMNYPIDYFSGAFIYALIKKLKHLYDENKLDEKKYKKLIDILNPQQQSNRTNASNNPLDGFFEAHLAEIDDEQNRFIFDSFMTDTDEESGDEDDQIDNKSAIDRMVKDLYFARAVVRLKMIYSALFNNKQPDGSLSVAGLFNEIYNIISQVNENDPIRKAWTNLLFVYNKPDIPKYAEIVFGAKSSERKSKFCLTTHFKSVFEGLIRYNRDLDIRGDFYFQRNLVGLTNFIVQSTVRFTPDAKIWIDMPYSIISPKLHIPPVSTVGDDLGMISPHSLAVKNFSKKPLYYNPKIPDSNPTEHVVTKSNQETRMLLDISVRKTRARERETAKIFSVKTKNPGLNSKEGMKQFLNFKSFRFAGNCLKKYDNLTKTIAHQSVQCVKRCIIDNSKEQSFQSDLEIFFNKNANLPNSNKIDLDVLAEIGQNLTKTNFEKLGKFTVRSGSFLAFEKTRWIHGLIRRYAREMAEKNGYTYGEVSPAYTTIRSFHHPGVEGTKGFILVRQSDNSVKILSELTNKIDGFNEIASTVNNIESLFNGSKFDDERTGQFHPTILENTIPAIVNDPERPCTGFESGECIWFWPHPAGNNLHVVTKENNNANISHHFIGRDVNAALNIADYGMYKTLMLNLLLLISRVEKSPRWNPDLITKLTGRFTYQINKLIGYLNKLGKPEYPVINSEWIKDREDDFIQVNYDKFVRKAVLGTLRPWKRSRDHPTADESYKGWYDEMYEKIKDITNTVLYLKSDNPKQDFRVFLETAHGILSNERSCANSVKTLESLISKIILDETDQGNQQPDTS